MENRILKGLKVAILTSGHDALDARVYDKEARSIMEMGAEVVVVAWLDEGEVGPVKIIPIKHPHSRFDRFVLQPWRCFAAARDVQPDIVHFHDAEILGILPLARLIWPRARFVYDVHEDFGNLLLVRDWLPKPIRTSIAGATHVVEKGLARLAHGIVGVTPPLTEGFSNKHRTTAYNFPSRRFYESSGQYARPTADRQCDVVHLGTLNIRRAAFLVEVLKHLSQMRPTTRSLVFGCTPQIVKYLRERVPLECAVEGPVPYDRVAERLGNARVGIDIHPWLSPHLRPAFAVKVAEYMASGCAVVASWMPVLEEVLTMANIDRGCFRTVNGESPIAFAAETVALLDRIGKGENPGESLRQAAMKKLVWEEEAVKIAALYRTIHGNHTGDPKEPMSF